MTKLLALDIGNTHIAAGLFDEAGDLSATWRFSTRREATSDELCSLMHGAFAARSRALSEVGAVAISGVVPSLHEPARAMAVDLFGVEPVVASGASDFGLQNAYEDPAAVGADRLVNALAARALAHSGQGIHRAAIVADFGTATTVDAVSSEGVYLGGAIAPGIGISSDALFRAAARLPRVALEAPERALATNTAASIRAGLVWGYAGLTKELIERVSAEVRALEEHEPLVLATGGLAPLIAPHVPRIDRVAPDLTLQGLRLLWQRQSS